MKSFNLAVIAGDGIGPEVVAEGLKVLDVVSANYGVEFKKTNYELGASYWHKTGEVLPDSVMADLAKSDVIHLLSPSFKLVLPSMEVAIFERI